MSDTTRHYLRRILIVYLVRQGLSVGEIAAQIGKSRKVVRWHMSRIVWQVLTMM